MNRRKIFRVAIFAVAAIALIMAMSGHGQQAAWMNGFSAGIAAAASTSADGAAAAAPMVVHAQMAHHGMNSGIHGGMHGGMHGGFGLIGGMFRLGFFLLMFVLFAKIFGCLMWRLSGQAGSSSWGCHGRDAMGQGGWNHDEMHKKWQERKRAWAKEACWDDDTSEPDSSNDSSEQRPPEERFVV